MDNMIRFDEWMGWNSNVIRCARFYIEISHTTHYNVITVEIASHLVWKCNCIIYMYLRVVYSHVLFIGASCTLHDRWVSSDIVKTYILKMIQQIFGSTRPCSLSPVYSLNCSRRRTPSDCKGSNNPLDHVSLKCWY